MEVSYCPRLLVQGTLKYYSVSAFHLVQCSGRLRKTSEGLKPVGGCLPLAPFFKMPQLYSRLWAQCRPAAQFREMIVLRSKWSQNDGMMESVMLLQCTSRIVSSRAQVRRSWRGSFRFKKRDPSGPSMAARSDWDEICTEPHRQLPAELWYLDLFQYMNLILWKQ